MENESKKISSSIFGLRFQSNPGLQPDSHALDHFLATPKKDGKGDRHGEDFAAYNRLFTAVRNFSDGSMDPDFRERLFFSVLAHSHFFSPALKSAVETFKYHRSALSLIDLDKPTAFITSAEAEIARLNPKKKDEAQKIGRLKTLAEHRRSDVAVLTKKSEMLIDEICHIAGYIRDNLLSVQKLCEASIARLVDLQLSRKKEAELIEEIKTDFKERVRSSLQKGPVTKEYLDSMKETVARLSKMVADRLREDVFTLTGLYEALHDHTRTFAEELNAQMARLSRDPSRFAQDKEIIATVEETLIKLLSEIQLEMKTPHQVQETEYEAMLSEKRTNIFQHIFSLLHEL